uniref:Uncharacterized protein n=1 Tax=Anguilla anguilla TaxID=7936 RepID=A0A0E9UT54_ANGAN
MSKKKGQEA